MQIPILRRPSNFSSCVGMKNSRVFLRALGHSFSEAALPPCVVLRSSTGLRHRPALPFDVSSLGISASVFRRRTGVLFRLCWVFPAHVFADQGRLRVSGALAGRTRRCIATGSQSIDLIYRSRAQLAHLLRSTPFGGFPIQIRDF